MSEGSLCLRSFCFFSFARIGFPRYNQVGLFRVPSIRVLCTALSVFAALCVSSCAVPLGPGYTIRKQTVDIRFRPSSEAPVSIEAHYRLVNTGNQPLASLDIRPPESSLLHLISPSVQWDGQPISVDHREDPAGDALHLDFAQPWPVKQSHTLTVKYEIAQGAANTSQLDFVSDSFYLPPGDAVPSLFPPKGTFSSGGAPPKRWILTVRVPQDFLVHATGRAKHQKKENAELRAEFEQRPGDLVPFVVAGRYHVWEYRDSREPVIFWKKTPPQPSELEPFARDVARLIQTYDSLFGPRANHPLPVWIADNPIPIKPFPAVNATMFLHGVTTAQPPPDFGFIPLSESGEPIWNEETTRRLIGESLARTWLGLALGAPGETPAYPIRVLPTYAFFIADEAAKGPSARKNTIRRALAEYDDALRFLKEHGTPEKPQSKRPAFEEEADKDVLFFFALEDQFGRDHLHAALRHMVQARRGRGHDLDDLIAALEAETRKPVAPLVRLWLKHPGVPEEFRARYAAPADTAPKENPR